MIDFSHFNSLVDVALHFDTQDKCRQAIAQSRWADGNIVCPYCGRHRCYTCRDGRYRCPECERSFNVTVGTIFENTKISLTKWFIAMYLISSNKKGISSHQLSRDINVTQKTAWFILHKIRTLFTQDDSVALCGEVECDEMYLGGREKNKHQSKKTKANQGKSLKTKTAIFGMSERVGRTAAFVVPDTKAETLHKLISQFAADNAEIFTDESNCYSKLSGLGYNHRFINHSKLQFYDCGVTTNTIEGFWGHFKRMIFGTYHFVSKGYLQPYVNEAVYRWNTRKANESVRFTDMFHRSISVVSYKDVRKVA